MDQPQTAPNQTPAQDSPPAEPTLAPEPDDDDLLDESAVQDLPVEHANSPVSAADAAAAHAKAHQKLKLIEVISIAVLIFLILAALAGWAYYSQNDNQFGASSPAVSLYE